jgi:hypothetical protein
VRRLGEIRAVSLVRFVVDDSSSSEIRLKSGLGLARMTTSLSEVG